MDIVFYVQEGVLKKLLADNAIDENIKEIQIYIVGNDGIRFYIGSVDSRTLYLYFVNDVFVHTFKDIAEITIKIPCLCV